MSIFKRIIDKEIPAHILYEDDEILAFLDTSQTTKGHTLIIPKKQSKNFLESEPELIGRMFKVAQDLAIKIQTNLHAKGFNILTNMNEVAGQTVFHFHIHLIPRYDENDSIKITFKSNEENLSEIRSKILK